MAASPSEAVARRTIRSSRLADAFTMPFAIGTIAALTFVSGMVVAGVMYETKHSTKRDEEKGTQRGSM